MKGNGGERYAAVASFFPEREIKSNNGVSVFRIQNMLELYNFFLDLGYS